MGGRGASSGSGAKVVNLSTYLAQRGVSDPVSNYMLDKMGGSNRMGETQRGKVKFEKNLVKNQNEYQEKRNKAIAEYKSLVKSGKIRPQTRLERSMDTARGNEDLRATHAARRMLAKRGIDWKTGKMIKGTDKEWYKKNKKTLSQYVDD